MPIAAVAGRVFDGDLEDAADVEGAAVAGALAADGAGALAVDLWAEAEGAAAAVDLVGDFAVLSALPRGVEVADGALARGA